jgi:RNA polymerase sigma factor (sigma-70 family)
MSDVIEILAGMRAEGRQAGRRGDAAHPDRARPKAGQGQARRRAGEGRLSGVNLTSEQDLGQFLALDDAFRRLEEQDPDAADVVRLRFFAGLSVEETAQMTGLSERTVKREWAFARAWLYDALRDTGA